MGDGRFISPKGQVYHASESDLKGARRGHGLHNEKSGTDSSDPSSSSSSQSDSESETEVVNLATIAKSSNKPSQPVYKAKIDEDGDGYDAFKNYQQGLSARGSKEPRSSNESVAARKGSNASQQTRYAAAIDESGDGYDVFNSYNSTHSRPRAPVDSSDDESEEKEPKKRVGSLLDDYSRLVRQDSQKMKKMMHLKKVTESAKQIKEDAIAKRDSEQSQKKASNADSKS
jgi:predicted heme/steroid binding protein